ncbi:MAG: hypothetical protein R3Y68_01810 [Rikenellaceae bacterium]
MNPNYIYQTIHTLSHHPHHVASHCRLLERHFLDIYFRPLRLDEEQIEREIVELLGRERVTRTVSVFVELRVDIEQEMELSLCGVSLYDGYAMRSISPRAALVTFDSPFGLQPNTARRRALDFASDIARNIGGEIAVECNRAGHICSLGGAALFAVEGRRLIASTAFESVERNLIIEAAAELSIEVVQRPIVRHELHTVDELFGCDHQGVIASSSYGDHLFMSIIANKIASQLTQPW